MKRTISALLVAAIALSGCSMLKAIPLPPLSKISQIPLPDLPQHQTDLRDLNPAIGKRAVCVLVPPDAAYFGEVSRGSGKAIASSIRAALRKIDQASLQISQLDSNAHALCTERGAVYFLKTTVLHYEDRPNGLFGQVDRIELHLSAYRLDDLDNRKSVIYEAQTNLLRSALLDWRNTSPTNLLGKDFDKAVAMLMKQVLPTEEVAKIIPEPAKPPVTDLPSANSFGLD